MAANAKQDPRKEINARLADALRGGRVPWRMPWHNGGNTGMPQNVVSKRPYHGANILMLQAAGFRSRWWGSVRQFRDLGGSVKVGQLPTAVVLRKGRPLGRRVVRRHRLYNLDQIAGGRLDAYRATPAALPEPRFEAADALVWATRADIRYDGDTACYDREGKFIRMPPRALFLDAVLFYTTRFHEMAHWAVDMMGIELGEAAGELVAEIASCYVASAVGIPVDDDLKNHAAYLGAWLDEMDKGPQWIFRVASVAAKAADYITGFRPE